MNAQEFVRQHYRDFDKHGVPDDGGVQFWSHFIDQCTDDACRLGEEIHVSLGFWKYYRPELFTKIGLVDNERFIAACYLIYLRRPFDDEGMKGWLEKLDGYGTPADNNGINQAINEFIVSQEYLKRCEPVAGLSISPASIALTCEQGRWPERQFVTIINSKSWDFQYSSQKIGDLSTWLIKVTRQSDQLAVELNAVGLPVGDYTVPVAISDGTDTITLQVGLQILGPSVGTGGAEDFEIAEFIPDLPRLASVSRRISLATAGVNPEKSPAENSIATQKAFDVSDVIYNPFKYVLDRRIFFSRSQMRITGDGPTQSGFIHAPHFEGEGSDVSAMLSSPIGPQGDTKTVTDIIIEKLSFDGVFYDPPPAAPGGLGAISAFSVDRLLIDQCEFKRSPFDVIGVLFGNPIARNVTVRRSHLSSIGRNGASIGSAQRVLFELVCFDDCPTQHYGPASGNGLDIEVETAGDDPKFGVDGVIIQDCIFEREITQPPTAGAGVAGQPAYNLLSNLIVRRNVFKNHPWGVQIEGGFKLYPAGFNTRYVDIDSNWILIEEGVAQGGPLAVYGETLEGGQAVHFVKFRRNICNGGNYVWMFDCRDGSILSNTFLTIPNPYDALIQVRGDGGLTVADNQHTTHCLLKPVGTVPNLIQKNNRQIPVPSFEQITPTPKLVQAGNKIAVQAKGAQRIYYFVDGLLMEFADNEKASFDLPSDLFPGQHTVGVRAIDRYANMSLMVPITISI